MNTYLYSSVVLGFLGGILCRSFLFVGHPFVYFLLLLAGLMFIVHAWHPRVSYLITAVLLLTFPLGILRVSLEPFQADVSLSSQFGNQVEMTGTVAADPDIRESSQRITLKRPDGNRILVIAPRFPSVSFGDQIVAAGTLETPEPFDTDGGRVFRYDKFLAKEGIFALLQEASVVRVGGREGVLDHALGFLIDIKRSFMHALDAALPEPHASLASGMLVGGKQGLGTELVDAFTIAGLVHIVVLSGYNIMIIAEAVMRALGVLPRRAALLVASIVIAAFVLAAGAGSAALRAGLMAMLALFARATGRTYDVLRALGLAVVLMLLMNPLLLAFDPGFQLSVAATLGLVLGAPIVEQWLSRMRSGMLREIAATTIAAQVFVLPLLLYQTGNLSLVSLPANILILPVVPVAMLLSFIASLVTFVLPALAILAGLPAYVAISYILFVTQTVANLPWAQVTLPSFPFVIVVALYILLGYWVRRLSKQLKPPL